MRVRDAGALRPRAITAGPAIAFVAVLLAAWVVYRPGLHGSFLFDDWGNLPVLGNHGPIRNWHALISYLLGGIAGPTGRPVALLSFLLDAQNWPAPAEPFKYTNILIHLLNGSLLAWLTYRLLNALSYAPKVAAWTAVVSAGIWMLHPLFVSTTLFVVQRMAMLATTFALGGMLAYLFGREHLAQKRLVSGYLWMSLGLGGGTLLATLSKENGALLPFLVLILESVVLQHGQSRWRLQTATPGWRVWQWLFLRLPSAAVLGYLLLKVPSLWSAHAGGTRAFTPLQRLLTEPRVVVEYLYYLLIPHAHTAGLFNDDVTASTSLLHPWTTLPALIVVLSLLGLAWWARARHPLLAFAILFYFAAQLVESTLVQLELYFEHRNYLPALFLPLPLALWLTTGKGLRPRGRALASTGILLVLAAFTFARATLWGHPFEQAAVWARTAPDSPRAQTTFALHLMSRHDFAAAAAVLENAARRRPANEMIQLNLLSAACHLGGVTSEQLAAANRALRHTHTGATVAYNSVGKFIGSYSTGGCRGLGPQQLNELIQSAMDNHNIRPRDIWLQNMLVLRGRLRMITGHPAEALELFEKALRLHPRPDIALVTAAMLGTYGHADLGVRIIDFYRGLPPPQKVRVVSTKGMARALSIWLQDSGYYRKEIARVRGILAREAEAAKAPRASADAPAK